MLPVSSRIKTLSNISAGIELSDIKDLPNKINLNNKIIELVTNYSKYSVKDLQELLRQGANAKLEVHFYANEYHSLAEKLIFSILDITIDDHKSLEKASDILNELFINGTKCDASILYFILIMGGGTEIVNTCAASYILLNNISLEYISIIELLKASTHNIAGVIVFLEIKLKSLSNTEIKTVFLKFFKEVIFERDLITEGNSSLKYFYSQFMILFSYGLNPNLINQDDIAELNQYKKPCIKLYTTIHQDKKIEDLLQEIINLSLECENQQLQINWQNRVKQAEQQLEPFINKLAVKLKNAPIDVTHTENDKTLLLKLFNSVFGNCLILEQINYDDKTISCILQHYYRSPGAIQALKSIHSKTITNVWKHMHSSSHVLRACNNAIWYMELLEKFNLAVFTEEEKTLLQLAVIYHDAAAEDSSKQEEERQSSFYFKRDLSGKCSHPLLEKIAFALECKEDDIHGKESKDKTETNADEDKYKAVIRDADRIDATRFSSILRYFPNLGNNNTVYSDFNSALLNFPKTEEIKFTNIPEKKTLFQRHLEAAMHGAADLAAVAGGYNEGKDLREKEDYATRYNLNIDNQRIKIAFERTDTPITQLNELLDNNVRRKIAQLAGIKTCTDPMHQVCKADTTKGIIRGIHSTWNDLKQVMVPKVMSHLEKMQFEHDMTLLSETTVNAINTEVARLKSEGIKMSLGTLTQDVLKSEPAKLVLKQRNIEVITEQRARGFNSNNEKIYQQMLVTASIKYPS